MIIFELIHKDALKVNYNELIGDEKKCKGCCLTFLINVTTLL